MGVHRVDAGTPHDAAYHGDDDDRVIGVADNRDDIGDEIDREGKVGEEQCEANPDSAWEGPVTGEPADEAKHIG
jgi:hypothetical protein